MDGWGIAWLVWLAAFLVIEGAALASKRAGATLSEHTWSWFRVDRGWGKASVAIPRGALLLFLVWLLLHLAFGWPKILGGFL
jgi:hypothetical protein